MHKCEYVIDFETTLAIRFHYPGLKITFRNIFDRPEAQELFHEVEDYYSTSFNTFLSNSSFSVDFYQNTTDSPSTHMYIYLF